MTTEKMREEFETWICGMWPGVSISRNPDDAAMFAGSYRDERVHMGWKGWQASRAAIEVELPPSPYMPDSEAVTKSEKPRGDAICGPAPVNPSKPQA